MASGVQFIDLAAQQARIKIDLDRRIQAVLAHGGYIMGPEVAELETRLAHYTGTKHCISCANGTDAILMALMALGVGRGDIVFAPTFTFVATAEVISLLGAIPYFVDVEEHSFNIDPVDLERQIARAKKAQNGELKGIIVVDLFGQPADYTTISAIAKRNHLFVIEDSAQAFGAEYQTKKTCSFGDVGTTSFFPAKPLGCYGDGGAIFCSDDGIAERLRSIRVHGQGKHKYENVRIGLNGRLDTMQAAVLLAKLEVFEDERRQRDAVAERYHHGLRGLQEAGIVSLPLLEPDRSSVWAQYTITLKKSAREEVIGRLKTTGIPTMVYYPIPLHLQAAF